jgi:ABC-2 type transport system permease protein
MNPRLALATASRILNQLRHDHRTLAMILVIPSVLMTLLAWLYDSGPLFDRIGAPLLGIFPFVVMFLVTSVATLRERTSGTLERLLTMPLGKLDLLLGYAIAFGLLAMVQAAVVTTLAVTLLGLEIAGPLWALLLVAVLDAMLGTALGLFVSAFAATEFQAVQFMPALVLPQFLLCGLLVPRDAMDEPLQWLSDVMPLSYAIDVMKVLTDHADISASAWGDMAVVAGFIVLSLALGAATLRRRTA